MRPWWLSLFPVPLPATSADREHDQAACKRKCLTSVPVTPQSLLRCSLSRLGGEWDAMLVDGNS